MSEFTKIDLDARALEHPKPLEQAIRALRELNDENYLYMLHRKNPIPFIDLASEQGFQTLSREDETGNWHILIAKNPSVTLEELLRV
ncbi:DUF2249 domain-containing protein [Sulfurovum sp. NBC37-1]|uniref:DUF2249 domain-containing protein n=1 Tax=Sulfurovum sp. (strain NBC37-1) TaxID=387093 RepID=UPI0001587934|nr:DUF2249 domain-containing protein [Sulfurovum sp. NBC37-1]BAF73223.1 conserved hypothetical protein [Sulfurovum sp. NBC37-1]